jgi:hypothetical protein
MILTRYVGTLEVVGVGPSKFRGTTTAGLITLSVWNDGSGAAAGSQINIGNNSSETRATIAMLSTGFSSALQNQADSLVIASNGAGGLGIAAHAGTIRFYTTAGTNRAAIDSTGIVLENAHGFRVKNTGAVPIDGFVISGTNNMTIGSDNGANVGSTTISAGQGILFRNQGAQKMEIEASTGHLLATGSSQNIGKTAQRWGTAFVTSVDTGDVKFDNSFKLTEHDKVGVDKPGMALCNEDGEIVAFFDCDGTVYFRRYAELGELKQKKPEVVS